MNLTRRILAAAAAVAAMASIASGAVAPTATRGRVARIPVRGAADPKAAAATTAGSSYSVEVPYVQSYAPPNGGQSDTLVLSSAHPFNITLVATDQHHGNITGAGVALPQTDTFGYFSLPSLTQNPSNPEVFVKVLDARTINGSYWIFYGHLTDLVYDLTVTDTVTGISVTYHKDAGVTAGGADTSSFPAGSLTTPAPKATRLATPNSFLRTSVDISNNTSTDGVTATLQYCYSSAGAFAGCTPQRAISLAHFDNFHQDDIVGYLGSLGDLPQAAVADSSGTLLVTFAGLPSQQGWEGTVAANTYNRVSEVDPQRGTVGCGQQVSLFFQSATATLVGTARDTATAQTTSAEAGSMTSTLGIHNTDAKGTGQNVTVDVTLYDPTTGLATGNPVTLSDVAPGELRFIDDLFSAAGVPTSVSNAIVFVDTHNTTTTSPTVEGFILDQDTNSLDTRYHEMSCASGCF